jgi:hypothetical protein
LPCALFAFCKLLHAVKAPHSSYLHYGKFHSLYIVSCK